MDFERYLRNMSRFAKDPFRSMDPEFLGGLGDLFSPHKRSRRSHHHHHATPHTSHSHDSSLFQLKLEVSFFKPKEITLKIRNNDLIIDANHEERPDEDGFISRSFTRRIPLPGDVDTSTVESTISDDGVLTITAKKKAHVERIIPVFPEDIHGHKVDHPSCATAGP